MGHAFVSHYRNSILVSLTPDDLSLLQPNLQPVELAMRQRLEMANRPVSHVYFLESGLASIVGVSNRGRRQAEVAIVGSEGMTGQAVVLGAQRSPNDTFIQAAGHGHAIAADLLREAMERSATLAGTFLRYAHVVQIQCGQTALANASGSIEERLARWLLMSHDRLETDTLRLTHEFLALMLGVRRPGVTIALQRLEQRGLVVVGRGTTRIADRAGLEEAANGLYGVAEAEYERLFPETAPA